MSEARGGTAVKIVRNRVGKVVEPPSRSLSVCVGLCVSVSPRLFDMLIFLLFLEFFPLFPKKIKSNLKPKPSPYNRFVLKFRSVCLNF